MLKQFEPSCPYQKNPFLDCDSPSTPKKNTAGLFALLPAGTSVLGGEGDGGIDGLLFKSYSKSSKTGSSQLFFVQDCDLFSCSLEQSLTF